MSNLSNIFANFFTMCKVFFQSIIDFINSILSIISTLFFWLKTLLSWIRVLIVDIFEGQLFPFLVSTFNDLSSFVWFSTALFISSLFFIVIVRIVMSFVFKIFRLNIDYKTFVKK